MSLLPLALATIVIAFFTGSDSLFYLAYALAGIAIVSRWWTHASARGIRVERRLPSHAFHGETVRVELAITSRARLPVPWLYIHESIPIALHTPNFERRVLSLSPGETARVTFDLNCSRRGYFKLGPLTMRVGDLLGIAPEQECTVATASLIVYPRIVPLRRLGLPSQLPFGTLASRRRVFEDASRFFGVREYAPTDSLRQIHWTSSAHAEHLLTKRFQPAIALDTLIFLDLNTSYYDLSSRVPATEMGIVLAASLASHLIERRQPVGLGVLGMDAISGRAGLQTLRSAQGRGHLINMLEMLARAEMGETQSLTELLLPASAHMHWGSTAVVIIPGDEPGLVPVLLRMRRQGLQVTVITTDPRLPFGNLEQQLKQAGISAYRITRDRDLDLVH